MTDDELEVAPLTQEEAQQIGEQKLLGLLADGGILKRRVKCHACGENTLVEIDTMDPELMVKILKFFDDQKKGGDGKGDAARRAQLLLKEVSELTSEELAELILVLDE